MKSMYFLNLIFNLTVSLPDVEICFFFYFLVMVGIFYTNCFQVN